MSSYFNDVVEIGVTPPSSVAPAYGAFAGWFGIGFLAASIIRFYGLSAFGWVLASWLGTAPARQAMSGIAGSLLLVVAASQVIMAT